jgi:hypothetical protein
MAYQLLERPYKFNYSKNPIRYMVDISNPLTTGSALEVELYVLAYSSVYDADTNPGTLVTRQTLFPNPDGKTYFYCEDFLNSQLEWHMPELNIDREAPIRIIEVEEQIRKFYIRYRQVTKTNPAPDWATEADNMRIVIKGGIAKEKFDRNNFFKNYLEVEKTFLTWQPANHFIGEEEIRYLTYFHTNEDTDVELILKARKVFTDGTEEVITKDFPNFSNTLLFHLPAGIPQWQFENPAGKVLWYYDISVVDGDGNVYAEPYRLYADFRKFYDVFSFIYHNSLGGIDTLRVKGQYDIEIVRDYTDIQKATIFELNNDVLPTENAAINITKYEVYKGDSGYHNSKEFQESLEDLLLSESVWKIFFRRWLRVMNLQKSQPLRASDDTKWSFPLQWRYTFDNSQFTPMDMDFGYGVNEDGAGILYGTCTAPQNLLAELVEDTGGQEYHFSWDPIVGAELYQLQYRKAGDIDWITVETVDEVENIVFDEAGQYEWRVRTRCGVDDYSAWSYGAGLDVVIDAPACAAPGTQPPTLLTVNGNQSQVKLEWTIVPGVSWYVIEYRAIGTSVWTSIIIPQALMGFVSFIGNFATNTQYEWRVKSNCIGAGTYSNYAYGLPFLPANMIGTCGVPSGLAVNVQVAGGIGTVGHFRFNWQQNTGGVATFQLQFRKQGIGDPWTTVDNLNSGPPIYQYIYAFLINAGHLGITWEWRVRTNCDGGGFSGYTNGPDFNT